MTPRTRDNLVAVLNKKLPETTPDDVIASMKFYMKLFKFLSINTTLVDSSYPTKLIMNMETYPEFEEYQLYLNFLHDRGDIDLNDIINT